MSEITVPVGATEVEYQITTSDDGPFVVPFPFFEQSDIQVFKRDDLTDLETELLVATDWTFTSLVTPIGQEGVGYDSAEITLNSALVNHTIKILRNTTIHRINNYPSSGPFAIFLLNNELARDIAIMQELEAQRQKYLSLPDGSFDTTPFDAAGRAMCNAGESESAVCLTTNRQADAQGPNFLGDNNNEVAVGAYDNWQNIFIASGVVIQGSVTPTTKIFDMKTEFSCIMQNRNPQEAAFRIRYRYLVECYSEISKESNVSYLIEIPGNSSIPFHFMDITQDIDYFNGLGTVIASIDIRPMGVNSNDLFCQWPNGAVNTSEPR
jgi:hypothetical protein